MQIATRLASAVAASAALFAVGTILAPVGTPFLLIVPLPALVLATRPPLALCAAWFVATAIIISAAIGLQAVPGFVLLFGLPALIMAAATNRLWSFEGAVLAGLAGWCCGVVCVALLTYGSLPAILEAARQQLMTGIDMALSTYSSIGAPESGVTAFEAERDALVRALLEVLPALAVLSGALTVILNLVLVRSWTDASHNVNLRVWRTPDALIWALIAAGFSMFAPIPAVAMVARNLFLILLGCYFCQGLAIVSYYLERFHLPRGLRVAGYVLIAVQHIVAAMVLALGIFDLWGNFRRLSAGPADLGLHSDGD
jgi:uncharacterized protein YybS (DUF2232 family)